MKPRPERGEARALEDKVKLVRKRRVTQWASTLSSGHTDRTPPAPDNGEAMAPKAEPQECHHHSAGDTKA